MRNLGYIVVAVAFVGTLPGCAQYQERTYAYQSDAYYPNGYYYAAAPAPRYYSTGYYSGGNYYPPSTAYSNPNAYATSDNYYASKWDYYRNYQGIHGGPERN